MQCRPVYLTDMYRVIGFVGELSPISVRIDNGGYIVKAVILALFRNKKFPFPLSVSRRITL